MPTITRMMMITTMAVPMCSPVDRGLAASRVMQYPSGRLAPGHATGISRSAYPTLAGQVAFGFAPGRAGSG
jgi:hypothetical protein